MRAGVQAGHPSVTVLNHGPADPSDLEASVRHYRVLLKTVEQVRHYEQLVAVMRQDHEQQLALLHKETAATRDSLTKWAETQIDLSMRQKERAIRNSKAREIARCLKIGQLERKLHNFRSASDLVQAERVMLDQKTREIEELKAALAKKNYMLEQVTLSLETALREKKAAEEAAEYIKTAEIVKHRMLSQEAAADTKNQREVEKANAEKELQKRINHLEKTEKERRKLLIDTLVGGSASGSGAFPPTNLQKQRNELIQAFLDRLRQAFVKLVESIGKQHSAGQGGLLTTIRGASERIEELVRGQSKVCFFVCIFHTINVLHILQILLYGVDF